MARKISVEIVGDSRSLERAFKRGGASASGFNRQLGNVHTRARRSFGGIAGAASIGFLGGGGLVAAFGSTISKAADFERSLNVLQTVSGATGAQMRRVSAVATKLGGDITLPATSAKDAADAMLELSKGGLSVGQSMAAARGTLQLAAAANIEVGDAATISARALNAFGLSGDRATQVADVLANAANASTGEITDFALGLAQSSASAHQYGLTLQDTTTALAELANKGIVGSDAGTSLKTMLARLVPQTKKAADEMADLGVRYKDAHGNLIPFRDQIVQYQHALARLTPVQRQTAIQTIFGSDAQRAANIILGGGVVQYDRMHRSISRQGAAARLAAAQNKGFKGAMDGLKSAIETVQIQLGTKLLPVLTKYVQTASKWLSDTRNQKRIMDGLKAAIAAVSTTAKTLRIGFNGLSRAVGGNRNAIKLLIGAFVAFKAVKMASAVAGVARNFGLLGRNAGAAGKGVRGARGASMALRGSLIGKAGLAGAVGLASFELTTMALKATGLDKKLHALGGTAYDVAAKLGLVKDPGAQFEGKKILGQKESRAIRQQAARLEARGLTPQQATTRILRGRPNVARRDVEVLAGVYGNRPVVIHTDVHLDKQKVGTAVTKHQQVRAKRNPRQKRGPNAG